MFTNFSAIQSNVEHVRKPLSIFCVLRRHVKTIIFYPSLTLTDRTHCSAPTPAPHGVDYDTVQERQHSRPILARAQFASTCPTSSCTTAQSLQQHHPKYKDTSAERCSSRRSSIGRQRYHKHTRTEVQAMPHVSTSQPNTKPLTPMYTCTTTAPLMPAPPPCPAAPLPPSARCPSATPPPCPAPPSPCSPGSSPRAARPARPRRSPS